MSHRKGSNLHNFQPNVEDEFMSVYDSDDSLKIANEKGKKDYSNSEPKEIN